MNWFKYPKSQWLENAVGLLAVAMFDSRQKAAIDTQVKAGGALAVDVGVC